jgi:hypothetical protein
MELIVKQKFSLSTFLVDKLNIYFTKKLILGIAFAQNLCYTIREVKQ